MLLNIRWPISDCSFSIIDLNPTLLWLYVLLYVYEVWNCSFNTAKSDTIWRLSKLTFTGHNSAHERCRHIVSCLMYFVAFLSPFIQITRQYNITALPFQPKCIPFRDTSISSSFEAIWSSLFSASLNSV